jgi:hypothetical protein
MSTVGGQGQQLEEQGRLPERRRDLNWVLKEVQGQN